MHFVWARRGRTQVFWQWRCLNMLYMFLSGSESAYAPLACAYGGTPYHCQSNNFNSILVCMSRVMLCTTWITLPWVTATEPADVRAHIILGHYTMLVRQLELNRRERTRSRQWHYVDLGWCPARDSFFEKDKHLLHWWTFLTLNWPTAPHEIQVICLNMHGVVNGFLVFEL